MADIFRTIRASARPEDRWLRDLKELALFSECSRRELRALSRLLTSVEVAPGEVLLREGNHGQQFVVIADGAVAVSRIVDGETVRVAVLGAGDFVGEMSLLHRQPRTATVTTLTRCTVFASNTREFFALLDAAPSVARRVAAAAARREEANAAGEVQAA
jgi:CRP-like cAMP-binding protein